MGNDSSFEGFGRRCELLLDVTVQTLRSDPDLRLCEGLRLIEATRTAIVRLEPSSQDQFDTSVLHILREILMNRFGVQEPIANSDKMN